MNCKECEIISGIETCLLCEVGYALAADGTSCTPITGSTKTLDLFVVPFNGYLMPESERTAQQSVDSAFGESLDAPFAFI